ncbi:MAG: M50 family metallopeptidase [Gammaproteobacteria bacterium]|nr:M50 family metallopeptidase [Gammaproteobacteria bacterium]
MEGLLNTVQIEQRVAAMLAALPLPWQPLRPELVLHPSGGGSSVLEDPQSGQLYDLNQAEALALRRLVSANEQELVGHCKQLLSDNTLTIAALQQLLIQCQQSGLCRGQSPAPSSAAWSPYWRLPLWRPQRFLESTLPLMQPLFSPAAGYVIFILGLIGIAGIAPQLDLYVGTVNYLTTATGAFWFVLCLLLLKLSHELAHAFTAVRHGVPVRQIGVLFILIWPLLYTDVTDAWKLKNRRQRAAIALAGIRFELAVAAVAACFWLFLPDGLLRSLAFIFSGTALVSSLLINANPLMRFDGYYALMDLWGIANLQQVAGEHCQAWRRAKMWGSVAPQKQPRLLMYGYAAWVWRCLIAVTMTLVSWQILGPAAGILIAVFFARSVLWQPLRQEQQYLKQSGAWRSMRAKKTGLVAMLVLAVFCVPMPQKQRLAAVVSAADQYQHSLPVPATLTTVLPELGQTFASGDLLAVFDSASLQRDKALAEQEKSLRQRQLDALLLTGEQGGKRATAAAELSRASQQLLAIEEKLAALTLQSESQQVVLSRHDDLKVGDTLQAGDAYLVTANPEAATIDIYLSQKQLKQWQQLEQPQLEMELRLPNGQRHRLFLDIAAYSPSIQFNVPAVLFDLAGGPIPSRPAAGHASGGQALGSWYQLRVPANIAAPYLQMPATASYVGEWRSLISRLVAQFSL